MLVVEDDEDVRAHAVSILTELGYPVLEAGDATAALRMLDAHGAIRLLFTDVGLPGGLNGRQLADEARRRRPDLLVLYTTGYARNAIVHQGRLDPGVELITKPFTFSGSALHLNASTSAAGSVRAEIQDEGGRPVEGFALADMAPWFGDELDAPMAWKQGGDVARLAGRPVRLRLALRDADVFAIQFR